MASTRHNMRDKGAYVHISYLSYQTKWILVFQEFRLLNCLNDAMYRIDECEVLVGYDNA